MFPQTDSFQNSSRHQSEPLEPCGVHSGDTSYRFLEVFNFKHFAGHISFNPEGDFGRNKQIKDYVIVSVVLALECGNTSSTS